MSQTYETIIHPEPIAPSDVELLESLAQKHATGELTDTDARMYVLLTKMHTHAFRDELTGLYNRKGFAHQTSDHLLRQKTGRHILLVIDINDFRDFNTRYGHAGGDRVLQHVAELIGTCLRGDDHAYRFAGDEFCVLACNVTPKGAKILANRMWRRVKESGVTIDGRRVGVEISIGYAEVNAGIKAAFVQADKALFDAKELKGTNHPAVSGVML